MKRVCLSVISCLLLVLLIAPVSTGKMSTPLPSREKGRWRILCRMVRTTKSRPMSHTMAWRERIMMQSEIKNRASQRRAAEMRKAAIAREAESNDPVNETQQVVK